MGKVLAAEDPRSSENSQEPKYTFCFGHPEDLLDHGENSNGTPCENAAEASTKGLEFAAVWERTLQQYDRRSSDGSCAGSSTFSMAEIYDMKDHREQTSGRCIIID